jgi:hypothetical protein
MKESHRKSLAHYPDPESCVVRREAAIEALTGAHLGRVLSCEISVSIGVPTVFRYRKATLDATLMRVGSGLCAVEDPGMDGNSTRENRETPRLPVGIERAGRRR